MLEFVGQQLGNYRLVQSLGHGGYAEVYLGEHIRLNTLAAIKVLHARLGNSEDIDHFQEEGRIVASLIHPHIIRVFDFDVVHETPFMVMDYAPNGSLRKRHPKGTQLALSTVLSYVRQIAEALQYAHDQHFVHRDIKPENMLLGRNDEVLLSDFGTAQVAQNTGYQNSLQEEVIGTVSYMAPEQFQGKSRPASDQYALAIVIYEWLAGELPFHGTGTEVAIQHTMAPIPSLRSKRLDISPAVEQVLLKALAKDYHQRYARIQDFAEDLEHASQIGASFYTEPTQNVVVPPNAMPPTEIEPHFAIPNTPSPLAFKPSPLAIDTVTSEAAQVGGIPQSPLSSAPPISAPMMFQAGQQGSVPTQFVSQSEPYYAEPPRRNRPRPWLVAMLILAMLMLLGSGVVWYLFILPRLGNTSLLNQSTPTVTYPQIAGTYSGTIQNTTAGITTGMNLAIQQNQGKITGQFTVGSALQGNGPFSGTVESNKHLQFTVQSYQGHAPLLFIGNIQTDKSLSGTYCSTGANGQCSASAGAGGKWRVVPS